MEELGKDDGGRAGKDGRAVRGRGKHDKEVRRTEEGNNKESKGETKGRGTGRKENKMNEGKARSKHQSRSKTRSSERKTPEKAKSLTQTATSIAKTMLGLSAIEPTRVTDIKIKKRYLTQT